MALKQTPWATGVRATLTAERAGATITQELTYTVKAGQTLAAADIVEFGVLPAYHDLKSIKLVGDALGGAITGKFGILTGEPGTTEAGRTLGNQFGDAIAMADATNVDITPPAATRLPMVDFHRAIGFQASANVAAGDTNKVLTVILTYSPPSN